MGLVTEREVGEAGVETGDTPSLQEPVGAVEAVVERMTRLVKETD
jgi:hypothetical protein